MVKHTIINSLVATGCCVWLSVSSLSASEADSSVVVADTLPAALLEGLKAHEAATQPTAEAPQRAAALQRKDSTVVTDQTNAVKQRVWYEYDAQV